MLLLPSAALRRSSSPDLHVDGEFDEHVDDMEEIRWSSLGDVCELREQIGVGGFGRVYKAVHNTTGLMCAVKVLPKRNRDTELSAQREVRALRRLCHENICEMYDAIQDADNIYLVLELIGGRDLFEELFDRQFMDEDLVLCILGQLLDALEHCHQCDVVHRDLKLENVMVSFDSNGCRPTVKLVDFGSATGPSMHDEDIVGTEEFMAPESYRGVCDAATDVWGVGVLLHMLLTGHGVHNVEQDLRECGASAGAVDLVRGFLQVDPERRLTLKLARKVLERGQQVLIERSISAAAIISPSLHSSLDAIIMDRTDRSCVGDMLSLPDSNRCPQFVSSSFDAIPDAINMGKTDCVCVDDMLPLGDSNRNLQALQSSLDAITTGRTDRVCVADMLPLGPSNRCPQALQSYRTAITTGCTDRACVGDMPPLGDSKLCLQSATHHVQRRSSNSKENHACISFPANAIKSCSARLHQQGGANRVFCRHVRC